MSYIVDRDAFTRIVAANESDPFVVWLEEEQIRPFADPFTIALTLRDVREDEDLDTTTRKAFEKRIDTIIKLISARNPASPVNLADADGYVSEVLADLLGLEGKGEDLSEVELIPAALAVERNFKLLAGEGVGQYKEVSDALPGDLGRLSVVDLEDLK